MGSRRFLGSLGDIMMSINEQLTPELIVKIGGQTAIDTVAPFVLRGVHIATRDISDDARATEAAELWMEISNHPELNQHAKNFARRCLEPALGAFLDAPLPSTI